MENEAINRALHKYVVALVRARDCSDRLALERSQASDRRTEPGARETDAISGKRGEGGQPHPPK
jgi:hypothetical protein